MYSSTSCSMQLSCGFHAGHAGVNIVEFAARF
jgi:hypothetical protein